MTLTIEVKSKSGKRSELYQTLQALLPTMRNEEGCLNCRVTQDVEDEDIFLLSSDWGTASSFNGYVQSASGGALLGAIKTLGQSVRVQDGRNAKWESIEILFEIRRRLKQEQEADNG